MRCASLNAVTSEPIDTMHMTRREAVIRLAFWMGASIAGPRLLAADFGGKSVALGSFNRSDISLLDEIGDTIIPTTDTPGAKSADIGIFIAMMVADCYWPKEQSAFREGLVRIEQEFEANYGQPFVGSPAQSRVAYLGELDLEQRTHQAAQKRAPRRRLRGESDDPFQEVIDRPTPHFFSMLKELTVLGYFTSEVASTRILGYLEVPGRYDGNVPYKPSDASGLF